MTHPRQTSSGTHELAFDTDGRPIDVRQPSAPTELVGFLRAFAATTRDLVRFLYYNGAGWLAVELNREPGRVEDAEQVLLRYVERDLPARLTHRELDVLTLLSVGLTNGQIARRLGTSVRTIATHVERLLSKLEQGGRSGLASLAVDSALLRMPIPGGVQGLTPIAIVEVQACAERPLPPVARTAHAYTVRFPRKRPLVLGTFVPEVAGSASDGTELLRGSELAVRELNARGGIDGREIQHVTVRADIYDAQAARAALGMLFDQDIDAINTSYLTADNPDLLDLIGDSEAPLLNTETCETQVRRVAQSPGRYGNVFQTCGSETHYGTGLIRLVSQLEARGLWRPDGHTIVAVGVDSSSTRTTNDEFRAAADRAAWQISAVMRCDKNKTSWSDVIDRIVDIAPAVVMVTHFISENAAYLQRELHARAPHILAYYVYAASVPAFEQIAGTASENVVWSTVTGHHEDALGLAFRRRYREAFRTSPGWSQASSAYDQVRLLAHAWRATGSRRPVDVIGHLRSVAVRGINGVYFLGSGGQSALTYPDTSHDPAMSLAQLIYQIQEGRPVLLAPDPIGNLNAFRPPASGRGLTRDGSS